jgi:hypothetical protein
MAEYERQTAKKCRIAHILNGEFIQKEGWEPSYVSTEVGKISRCNVMGIVVSKDPESLLVDDGSAKITLRTFGEIDLERFDIGDPVLIIARPREYNEQLYLAGEVVKKVDAKWLEYRRAEIAQLPTVEIEDEPDEVEDLQEEAAEHSQMTERVLDAIRDLDDGDGADVDDVIDELGEGESTINSLMEEGEVFEIKPGKVKVLE